MPRTSPSGRRRARALCVATIAITALGLTACSAPTAPEADDLAAPDVGVQLFQLPWTSIADECEAALGPRGFAWVLTSPPQEHIDRDEWWASYQPVSYEIDTRLGTRDEFVDMVRRCDQAGVAVIADAVINHMTGQDAPGTGWAGTPYEHYSYPGLYGYGDFHHCGLAGNDDISDYGSREQVQTCELVNLADLDTSSESVRASIVGYLNELLSLGVAGFRIDAAKHMAASDVEAIVGALPEGTRIISEVIRGGSEPIQPEEYAGFGEVFEFTYSRDLIPQVLSGILTDPALSDPRPQHVPDDAAVVFIDNHDTERGESDLTYRDGDLYLMANALMLADDYGTPVVYSGYVFSDRDAGAPADVDGRVNDTTCGGAASDPAALSDGDRTCAHASTAIAGMLEWRRVAGSALRLPGVEDGDAYGFEREGRAVIAANPGSEAQRIEVPTSLPNGSYCDVALAGARIDADSGCPEGGIVAVADGLAVFELGPMQTAAIHLFARA
jgi:alpha-amylase